MELYNFLLLVVTAIPMSTFVRVEWTYLYFRRKVPIEMNTSFAHSRYAMQFFAQEQISLTLSYYTTNLCISNLHLLPFTKFFINSHGQIL